jgi:hypothetical protein
MWSIAAKSFAREDSTNGRARDEPSRVRSGTHAQTWFSVWRQNPRKKLLLTAQRRENGEPDRENPAALTPPRDDSREMLHQRLPRPFGCVSWTFGRPAGNRADATRPGRRLHAAPSTTTTQHWPNRNSYALPTPSLLKAHSTATAEIRQTICLPSLDNLNSCKQLPATDPEHQCRPHAHHPCSRCAPSRRPHGV